MQQRTGTLELLAGVASVPDSALIHVAAKLLLTQRLDQLHQVRVTSETRHPWHKTRDNRNSTKPQWKVEQKVG
eukprot:1103469-Pelagomonas_calceolata.AAC.1